LLVHLLKSFFELFAVFSILAKKNISFSFPAEDDTGSFKSATNNYLSISGTVPGIKHQT